MRTVDRITIVPFRREYIEEVLAIERENFEHPWSASDFERSIGEAGRARGIVAEIDRCFRRPLVIGYAVFHTLKPRIDIWNLAVDRRFWRRRVGSALVQSIQSKLRHNGPSRLRVDVRERNLAAQLFLRSCGFRCVTTLPRLWQETDEDCYRFVYRLPMFDPLYVDMACDGI